MNPQQYFEYLLAQISVAKLCGADPQELLPKPWPPASPKPGPISVVDNKAC